MQFIAWLLLAMGADGFSFLTQPPSLFNQPGRFASQTGPCEYAQTLPPVTGATAGQELQVSWPHSDPAVHGLVRLSLVPRPVETDPEAYDRNVLGFYCFVKKRAISANWSDVQEICSASLSAPKTRVTVALPMNLPGGIYTLQWMAVIGNASLPFYSCARLNITNPNVKSTQMDCPPAALQSKAKSCWPSGQNYPFNSILYGKLGLFGKSIGGRFCYSNQSNGGGGGGSIAGTLGQWSRISAFPPSPPNQTSIVKRSLQIQTDSEPFCLNKTHYRSLDSAINCPPDNQCVEPGRCIWMVDNPPTWPKDQGSYFKLKRVRSNGTSSISIWQLRLRTYRDTSSGWGIRIHFKKPVQVNMVPGFDWVQNHPNFLYIYASDVQFQAGAVQYADGFSILFSTQDSNKDVKKIISTVAWKVDSGVGNIAAAQFQVFHTVTHEYPFAREFTAILEIHAFRPCKDGVQIIWQYPAGERVKSITTTTDPQMNLSVIQYGHTIYLNIPKSVWQCTLSTSPLSSEPVTKSVLRLFLHGYMRPQGTPMMLSNTMSVKLGSETIFGSEIETFFQTQCLQSKQ